MVQCWEARTRGLTGRLPDMGPMCFCVGPTCSLEWFPPCNAPFFCHRITVTSSEPCALERLLYSIPYADLMLAFLCNGFLVHFSVLGFVALPSDTIFLDAPGLIDYLPASCLPTSDSLEVCRFCRTLQIWLSLLYSTDIFLSLLHFQSKQLPRRAVCVLLDKLPELALGEADQRHCVIAEQFPGLHKRRNRTAKHSFRVCQKSINSSGLI